MIKMVTKQELADMFDHSMLKNKYSEKDYIKFCRENIRQKVGGICIPPAYTKLASKFVKKKGTRVVTVIGYPTGLFHPKVKAFEAAQAVKDGTDEIDMVMNVSALKSKKYELVKKDIDGVVRAAEGKIVKVIIETGVLTKKEIEKACRIILKTKAKYVKTSTGYIGGAKVSDIKLIKKIVGKKKAIKASGGIRNLKSALAMVEAGATRLGTSSSFKILKEFK